MHWISKEVRELQRKYSTTDPYELVDCLGYIVIPHPFRKIRGMLLVLEGIACIGYSTLLPRRQQELVVCHEIAHRLLHPELNYFTLLENTCFYPGKFEHQADRFVAELLLAERKPRPEESVYEFAARYEVPVELVNILAAR